MELIIITETERLAANDIPSTLVDDPSERSHIEEQSHSHACAPATLGYCVRAAAYLAPIVLTVAVVYGGMLAMPPSALELPAGQFSERVGPIFFPQGWAFFTKSPRTPEFVAMALPADGVDEGPLESLVFGPNAQARWYFGADRTSRIQEFEYGLLDGASSGVEWFSCEERASVGCVRRLEAHGGSPYDMINDLPAATFCGDVVLVRAGVMPWAYANEGFSDHLMIDEIKLLRISCSEIDS